MRAPTWIVATVLLLSTPTLASAEVTLRAPDQVAAGADFTVSWQGGSDPRDFVTLLSADAPEGDYDAYQYARKESGTFAAPDDPGTYEIRYLAKDAPYPTLARKTIVVTPVTATLNGPSQADAGGTIEFSFTGPGHPRDFITVVEAGAAEQTYDAYVYVRRGSPATLTVPEKAGDYELRYLTRQKYYTLARHPFTVVDVSASVEGPASVTEGATFEVRFVGTGNKRDFVTIVPEDAPEKQYGDYEYTKGDTATLRAPEAAGDYEIRYLTASEYRTLASQPIVVTGASATLDAPSEVVGGASFPVTWTGVGNKNDYVTIVEHDAGDRAYGDYAYVRHGNPVELRAPFEPGDYELRYALGASRKILARRPIRVTEPETLPGSLQVVHNREGNRLWLPEGAAVELILDASGSMLQRQGGTRRIEIAKSVLQDLVESSLPTGTPFALRVFGHREADSCRTDLEIALSPLDPQAAAGRIGAIEAKNLAKTPIADSLERVAQDLAGTGGPSVIVLVTDGEETCGGDPARAIEALRGQGFDVRVSIVGFAIDDDALAATFRSWADLGGGAYHDSTGADDLADSIRASLRAAFDVIDANGDVAASGTVGGARLQLPAGDYRLRVEGTEDTSPITIAPGERVTVDLASDER